MMRSRLSATCRDVNGVPSWKRTPSRRRKVQERPSRETVQEVASPGSTSARAIPVLKKGVEDLAGDERHGAFQSGGRIENGRDGSESHSERRALGGGKARHGHGSEDYQSQGSDSDGPCRPFISKAHARAVTVPRSGTSVQCFDTGAPALRASRRITALFAVTVRGTKRAYFSVESSFDTSALGNG